MRKRIGIFGGSFDPPHKGHVEICRHLLVKNDVDEIWAVPCFMHPYNKVMAPFKDRVMMCKFAFEEFGGRVIISDAEKKMGDVSYTINTIEHFTERYPEYKFYFIVGSDTAKDAAKWKDSEKINSLIQLIRVPRGPDSLIPDISSTDVRNCIKNGKSFKELVTRQVAVYIVTHGLYS